MPRSGRLPSESASVRPIWIILRASTLALRNLYSSADRCLYEGLPSILKTIPGNSVSMEMNGNRSMSPAMSLNSDSSVDCQTDRILIGFDLMMEESILDSNLVVVVEDDVIELSGLLGAFLIL